MASLYVLHILDHSEIFTEVYREEKREEEGARSPSMQSASRNRTSHRDSKENAVCCRFDCALVSPVEDT